MAIQTDSTWVCWGKPEDGIKLERWCYSERSAKMRYGRRVRFYGKRYCVRLDAWQAMVGQSLSLLQAEVDRGY